MKTKQTAVDFLIENIEIALKMNKVEINPIYRFKTIIPIFTMAKEMEYNQMGGAFISGGLNWETPLTFSEYLKETYGEKFGEKFGGKDE
jgi:hypothetical protein